MKKLFEIIKSFFIVIEPKCRICNDSKKVEGLIMGTDTDWVECSYCSDKCIKDE